jgi:quinol monooxygenase YgiN
MYGLINKVVAAPNRRNELIALLKGSSNAMPGCLSYVIAEDAADENGIWITEIWDSEESHQASLSLSTVKQAIAKARPLIAGFSKCAVTKPVAGVPADTRYTEPGSHRCTIDYEMGAGATFAS